MIIAKFVIAVIIGYLLGSIPFGVLIGKRTAGVDIRQYGSGRMGTTNVLRTIGRKAAVLAACLDILKGALVVVFAGLIVGESYLLVGDYALGMLAAQVLAGLAAIVGHIWSVFLKFKGGRGVATFFGGLIALCLVAAAFGDVVLISVAAFGGVVLISVAALTRYASLGSISGAVGTCVILVPLTIVNGFPIEYLVYTSIGAGLIIIMHRDNIARLISGKERKLGEKVGTGGLQSG
jgi:glycerol-3-phosphate acyltransferase PlsY